MKIFHTNKWTGTDIETIGEVIRRGDLGFGPNVTVFEEKYSLFSKKKFNTSTNSASAAAFMIFHYLLENYGQCDVYTTSLGFTSPAWAAKHFGHNLIFVDVQDDLQFSSEHYRQIRKESGNKFQLYHNNIISLLNTVLMQTDRENIVFVPFTNLTYFKVTDKITTDQIEQHLKTQLEFSNNLSGKAAVERNKFFNAIYQKIENRKLLLSI